MPPFHSQGICGRIIGMHDAGASIQTIATFLGIPPTTVHDTIRRFHEQGHLENLPIAGQPRKLNDHDIWELAQVVQQNHRDMLV
ncbi:hypothetical protein O181_088487 [Austropuccinia psidii MF-1]|uniref:Paired domain-containing protein n=1 Tax=Austropuccinia psidii MF-1 TaxID=1389203 RepID=A0A9Q3IRL6_9BASI|nr:hypothetical protein [Austropuccinia psidii MF-1]